MPNQLFASGTVHKVPVDLKKILLASPATLKAWTQLTPLGRNEWICWIEEAKKPATRQHRIKRTGSELLEGKRRPCCWYGCIHRPDKPISPSVQKLVLDKKLKSKKLT